MKKEIEPTEANNQVLSEVFAIKVKEARDKKFPSAESIVENLGNTRVIFR